MDTKAKKRVEVLRKKIADFEKKLAGAKAQMDDPQEVLQLQKDIAAAKVEIEKLKG